MSTTIKVCGFLNHAINELSFELHIPGYQFCGPETYLEKRLTRGDRGINRSVSRTRHSLFTKQGFRETTRS